LLEGVPRKIKIIVNPTAGGGKGRKLFPLLRQKLLDRKISFHLQFSESAEHTTFLARQAQREGNNLIVSCGGDGTAHQALQALVGTRAVLGLIPLGTANDLPRNLDLPEDLDFTCDLLNGGKIRKIDVIQVNSGEYMIGAGGVGFNSEVNAFSQKIGCFLLGESPHTLPVLFKTLTYRPKKISLRIDNESLWGPALMVAFGNIRSYGKGKEITPLAEPDDGLLDICWIDPVKKIRLFRFFPTVYAGEHLELPEVHYFRSTMARVESPIPLDLFGDGEFLSKTPFTLRVLPQALRVLVP
jgi:diacylglycerol kinase (ATP)